MKEKNDPYRSTVLSIILTYLLIYCGSSAVNPIKTEFLLENKNSVHTSQEAHYVFATKINQLILFRERVAIYYENHTKHNHVL